MPLSRTFDFSFDPRIGVAITSSTQPLLDSDQSTVMFLPEVWEHHHDALPLNSHTLCTGQFHWGDDWCAPVT